MSAISKAESLRRQEQIEELMRQGKTTKEIAEAIGISKQAVLSRLSSGKISNFQQHQQNKQKQVKTSYPKQKQAEQAEQVDAVDEDDEVDGATTFEAQVTPTEGRKESFLDRAKAKLGLAPEKNVEPVVQSRKLNKGQQEFVNLAAPIARQAGVMAADFAWGKIAGGDYVPYLSPSEEVADKIMLPLTRILARTFSIKYKGVVTPNQIDAMASLAAAVGYGMSSWKMYSQMKKEEQYEYVAQEESSNSGPRAPRAFTARRQAQHDHASSHVVSRTEDENLSAYSANAGSPTDAGDVDTRNFSEAERFQYERLAQLRMRDIESRRRRSGIAG